MAAGTRDWALLVTLGVLWGAAFMATKVATQDFAPFSLAGLRLALGALALLAVLRVRGERLPGLSHGRFWGFALAVAVLSNALPFSLLSWAQRHIDSASAGVLMATVPLFALPLAAAVLPGERLTLRRGLGFVIGFAGVVVLIGPDRLTGLGTGGGLATLAQAACLGVALCYASGSIVSKLAPSYGLLRFAAAALMLASCLTLPVALVLERPFAAWPTGEGAAALLYLGLVPTALATVMLLKVIEGAGPAFLSLVNYMVPVWAVVFGWAVLAEDLSPRLWLALGMILTGFAVAQARIGVRRGGHARG